MSDTKNNNQKSTADIIKEYKTIQTKTLEDIEAIVCYDSKEMGAGSRMYAHYIEKHGWVSLGSLELETLKKDTSTKTLVENALQVVETYVPFEESLLNRDYKFLKNTWRNPAFAFNEANYKGKLPDVYQDYFRNLFKHTEDVVRVIDWMALALRGKVQKFLYFEGVGGTGKGLFGEINTQLHLSENTKKIRTSDVGSNFNKGLDVITFLYLDEPILKKEEQKQILKEMINTRMNIEGKGINSGNKDIYFNLFISGNKANGIPLEDTPEDNRRFYCPETVPIPLAQRKPNVAQFYKEAVSKENIEQLYFYLMERKVQTDFSQDIITDHHRKLVGNSAPQWVQQLVSGLLEPKLIDKEDSIGEAEIQQFIRENCHTLEHRVGRRPIEENLELYYNNFKFTRTGGGASYKVSRKD